MKYWVYFQGKGEGCDYTISCNEALWEIENVNSDEKAVEVAKKMLFGTEKDPYDSQVTLEDVEYMHVIKGDVIFKVEEEEIDNEAEKRKKENEKIREKELYLRLKKKYEEE